MGDAKAYVKQDCGPVGYGSVVAVPHEALHLADEKYTGARGGSNGGELSMAGARMAQRERPTQSFVRAKS